MFLKWSARPQVTAFQFYSVQIGDDDDDDDDDDEL